MKGKISNNRVLRLVSLTQDDSGQFHMRNSLEKKVWWGYIHEDLQELLYQSLFLIEMLEKFERDPSTRFARSGRKRFHDYSFVVFPAAKAYEGFLKTLFLDLNLISEKDYSGKRFRIGKALNPALKSKFRKKISVYDRIVEYCGGRDLANSLWDTWKTCRNVLFHWFPNEKNAINFNQAKERVEKVINSFDLAFGECKIK